jgi:putative nucleotidyltransferase with HDIG domain
VIHAPALRAHVTARRPLSHRRIATQRLCVVIDKPTKAAAIRRELDGIFDLHWLDFDRIGDAEPGRDVLFDIDFNRGNRPATVKEWFKRKPKDAKVIFAIDRSSHLQSIQATALGATGILHRPLERDALVRVLMGDLEPMSGDGAGDPMMRSPGVGEALEGLRNIFESACLGVPLDMRAINSAGAAIISRMESQSLESWLDTVRRHHSQTYQHCLIVTGVTVAFAQHLGFSRPDQQRMSIGAMLHDIGKARVPLAILEKPSPLTGDEMATMRRHPEYGLEALKSSPGLHRELLDIVANHHEHLDGSGYPHGLSGREISDPVRIVTICDIFGALIERRAYKRPLSADVAYQTLLDMGEQLDRDLVRAFGFTRTLRLAAAA